MDLSGLKWPIIILVVVGVGWLLSSGGVNYMFKQFTQAEVGQDPKRDKFDEKGLSWLGGYLLRTWRYEKALQVLAIAIDRYPNGKNVWYNKYRMVKCAEKLDKFALAVELLEELIRKNAHEIDPRVPVYDNLRLRADKLIEMYELKER